MGSMLAGATSPSTIDTDLVLVPIGSLEQHGPHLPLETDTVIAEAVARGAAARLPGSVVAPALAYGSSGEHQAFPGTSSIGADALHHVIVELTRSIRTWAARVVYINGHGGNVVPVSRAVAQLADEGHEVRWLPCAVPGADAHAGRTETSLMLHLRPESVHLDLAVAGNRTLLRELMPLLGSGGVQLVSPNGVLGDPAGASRDEGRQHLETMVDRVCEALTHVPA